MNAKAGLPAQAYELPVQVQKRTPEQPEDIFEFTCAAPWARQYIYLSHDQSTAREEGPVRKISSIQAGAITSLICGISSWVYQDHLLVEMERVRMYNPVPLDSRIRIVLTLKQEVARLKEVGVGVYVLGEDRPLRVLETTVRLTDALLPR